MSTTDTTRTDHSVTAAPVPATPPADDPGPASVLANPSADSAGPGSTGLDSTGLDSTGVDSTGPGSTGPDRAVGSIWGAPPAAGSAATTETVTAGSRPRRFPELVKLKVAAGLAALGLVVGGAAGFGIGHASGGAQTPAGFGGPNGQTSQPGGQGGQGGQGGFGPGGPGVQSGTQQGQSGSQQGQSGTQQGQSGTVPNGSAPAQGSAQDPAQGGATAQGNAGSAT